MDRLLTLLKFVTVSTFMLGLACGSYAQPAAATIAPVKNSASTAAIRSPSAPKTPIKHLWNLQGVDIKQVIKEISKETGKNFILDPQVQGKVTIISSHPMGPKESYQVFLSTLRVLGFAAVPDGINIKIVPDRNAASQAGTMQDSSQGDLVVVQAVRLHNVAALQLIPALRPLMPSWGSITAYSPSNTVIISSTAANVHQLDTIISQVDTPESNGIDVIQLKHAEAKTMDDVLNRLIKASHANGAANTIAVSADVQSNSLLLSGDKVSRLRMKVLIAKLDNEDGTGINNTKVIDLHYIQVKDILPILKGMVHQSVSYSMSSTPVSSGGSSSSSGSGESLGQASQSFLAAASSQLNNATINGGSSGGKEGADKVTIVGDVTNNALVITADPATMLRLKTVIKRLDVPPKQVLVRGIIAEVDAQTANQIGIQWGMGGENQTGSALGISGESASSYAFSGGGMGVGFVKSGDMRALIALLSTDTNANIVSTPSITVLNNSSADIQVGKEVPTTSAEYQSNSQNPDYNPPTTFDYKAVGLTLRVIPQVTGSNSVRLIIDQENSTVVDDADASAGNPNKPTTDEKISTQVIVNNQQVVVLGGLLSSQDNEVESRVPVLGSIPILGNLFKQRSSTKVKKDLMIFLQPVILDDKQLKQQANKNYDLMRDVAILNGHRMSDVIASSHLPPRQPRELPSPFNS